MGIYSELMRRLPDAEFVIYEPADCRVASWFDWAPNVSAKRTPLPSEGRARRFLGGLGYWGSTLSSEVFDLFEGFNLPLVKAPKGRTLLTIHDVRALRPDANAAERAVFRLILRRALKAADHVITVSEAVRAEILDFCPGTPISVVYNGLSVNDFIHISESQLLAVRRKFALPDEFLLAVGHLERRKNYLRLIDAIAELRDCGRACSLRIVGNDGGARAAIEERINAMNLVGSVKVLSGLSDLEVRCVYKLCSLFVFPSFYEGFGIPILEAMAAGCPMVLSDIPAFKEITQDKGVYFSCHNTDSMAAAIDGVLSSAGERVRLVEYGNERVQAFGFRNIAAQVERLYRSLA